MPSNIKIPKTQSVDWLLTMHKWVRRGVSVLFFLSLVGLSGVVLNDIGKASPSVHASARYSAEAIALEADIRVLRESHRVMAKQRDAQFQARQQASERVKSAEAEFSNWSQLRSVTQNDDENPEVRERLAQLDALRNFERIETSALQKEETRLLALSQQINEKEFRLTPLRNDAQDSAAADSAQARLVAFMYRLLIVGPILALGVFAFLRYRNHAYSPLVWGYILFSVYAFFFGLLPYLPSFGGYLRYGMGVLLAGVGGVYAIRGFSSYLEQQRKKMEADKALRATEVDAESAVLAFKKHVCPSCGQDYSLAGEQPGHCFHCGLELFKKCSCGHRTFAFFSYCSNCGCAVKRGEVAG